MARYENTNETERFSPYNDRISKTERTPFIDRYGIRTHGYEESEHNILPPADGRAR